MASAHNLLGVIILQSILSIAEGVPSVIQDTPHQGGHRPRPVGRSCRCVPDQWEGVLSSVDREFDLERDRTNAMETAVRIHYDLTNERFAMIDLNNGKKIIDDYKLGQKFLIGNHGCVYLNAHKSSMHPMCLPDNAELVGQYLLGSSIPVALWQVVNPRNMTMRTTVLQKNCIPISEEIYMANRGYSSLTNSLYLDLNLGIRDTSVFDTPQDCAPATDSTDYEDEQSSAKKRSGGSYTEIIREKMLHM